MRSSSNAEGRLWDDSNTSWAGAIPVAQGLYHPDYEKDACGVGFIVDIPGRASHKLLSQGRGILCNMTHRGAVGSDTRDGDGAGVMTAIPHEFFVQETTRELGINLPAPGRYATGNLFFHKNDTVRTDSKAKFKEIARQLGLRVLGWRRVPVDNTILGPASGSLEPVILQPFVVLDQGEFDAPKFERLLYILRKHATHIIGLKRWFYVCSLCNRNIVYKGQLSPVQVYNYFHDLNNHAYKTHFALVHSRFSTNTFPSWDRAQPMRWCAHNGEINTLRGNKNWMRAREGIMKSAVFGSEITKLYPIIESGGSDSAAFDNVLELLVMNGTVSLPEAIMMMIPEAWQNNHHMEPEKRAFYHWAGCLMEPWDGPALFTFSDGRYVGASLDRNGLRPCRFYVTSDDTMICASEVGTIYTDPLRVIQKGRLQPGKMLLVDTKEGRIVDDAELKMKIANRRPFGEWLQKQMMTLDSIKEWAKQTKRWKVPELDPLCVGNDPRMKAFGFTIEQLNLLIMPMVKSGKEALGSMGNDSPLACMSDQPRLIYDYFRQLFAQVTNPPIDPIREAIVMSLECYVGPEGNLLEIDERQCKRLLLPTPILSSAELYTIRRIQEYSPAWGVSTIDITFPREQGVRGYLDALERVCAEISQAIQENSKILILSDARISEERIPLSALIATGGVHQYLIRNKQRAKVALFVETGEAREVHHMCVLLGYGADAVCPYLAIESMLKLKREKVFSDDVSPDSIIANYKKAVNDGILKVMSKMGISTLQSYKGAQIFEALGLDPSVITRCFAGTASRIKGVTFDMLAFDAVAHHELGYPTRDVVLPPGLPETGEYHWRCGGEAHVNDALGMGKMQDAVRRNNDDAYSAYAQNARDQIRACTLRGMLDFDYTRATSVPIEEVEPWTDIVKRFCTGAMSYGSISMEAHSTLAIAMNRLGGKSNTGEGGEDSERSKVLQNGDTLRSAIKQVASGRFGVTSNYLADSDELQIKMAQGAKPGEGGELPGHKVSESIAFTRKSTPGVGLISPPPHHDIYSIEDLKQLIYDLKCSNPRARVSVKLVSEVGVGVIAAGVAKARADHILIAGHDGGTGASRWTGIKYAGLPWELGLAETHQTLVLNDLRGRVIVQTDGQIKTGRDVAIACLLGAEEWGFSTAPLIAMGCIMMRKCHLNTCPVGIATQDPKLRKKFEGTPEHVINFFYYVAQEVREIMAKLGFRKIEDMVGRSDFLKVDDMVRNVKTTSIDLTAILTPAFTLRPGAATHNVKKQNHMLHIRLDNKLIDESEPALQNGQRVRIISEILNTDRAVGTTLSFHLSRRFGEKGLPDDTIHVMLSGSAGQSFGAFLAPGITLELEGDANDYVGKGLSGGHVVVYPPKGSNFHSEENVIVGNVCLYGATAGKAFFRGLAAERFCVRNSGAVAVVEGCGDHACEYMTGGKAVILGPTGRNFAAGMSGGIAYVLDSGGRFRGRCNTEMVELETVHDQEEVNELRSYIAEHRDFTGSDVARRMLENWPSVLTSIVKVVPIDYKRVLEEMKAKRAVEAAPVEADDQCHAPKTTIDPLLVDIEDSAPDAEAIKLRAVVVDKLRGFMKYKRRADPYRNPKRRVNDWREVSARQTPDGLKLQAARCMDCGVPFCQSEHGCPIGNVIPKWNDLVFRDAWKEALDRLLLTNNFPEFTGRVCPAPCEGACVLGINELPVSVKSIECAIIDRGFAEGWIVPQPPPQRTGRRVAIIGSGPAGLAAADQLNKAGHIVTVYDRNDRHGGLLVYGIPNMKLDKSLVQRRVDLMSDEGVRFVANAFVGGDPATAPDGVTVIDPSRLRADSDALLICTGATWPRDLPIPNRNLNGIHFAMEFLQLNTKSLLDSELKDNKYLSAKDKHVIVIGGGDTGCDCIATAVRHGAKSVTNFELLPQPPATRAKDNPWPEYPRIFRVEYGHSEVQALYGKDPRQYEILSKEFVSDGKGNISGLNTVRVSWHKDETGRWTMKEVSGTEQFFQGDLVLLAMGFLGPEKRLLERLGVKLDGRSNIHTPKGSYATSVNGVFAAGDCRRGQSLIVWGIDEGRQAARAVDTYLMGDTYLPVTGGVKRRTVESLQSKVNTGLATKVWASST